MPTNRPLLASEPFIRLERKSWAGRLVDGFLRHVGIRPLERFEIITRKQSPVWWTADWACRRCSSQTDARRGIPIRSPISSSPRRRFIMASRSFSRDTSDFKKACVPVLNPWRETSTQCRYLNILRRNSHHVTRTASSPRGRTGTPPPALRRRGAHPPKFGRRTAP